MKTKYIVTGSVRGEISQHNKLSAAIRSLSRDRNACANMPGGNSHSDCEILHANGSPLSEDEHEEVMEALDGSN